MAHARQADNPEEGAYVQEGQGSQASGQGEKNPAAHGTQAKHTLAPGFGVYVPCAHFRQLVYPLPVV